MGTRSANSRFLLNAALLVAATVISACDQSTEVRPIDDRIELPTACEVHGEQLLEDTVPIVYGLLAFPPGYIGASMAEFPWSNEWVGGGCIVGDEEAMQVLYCPACRAAEARWRKEHP